MTQAMYYHWRKIVASSGAEHELELYDESESCARCGNIADLDVMDFGAFNGDMICTDCWDAECERAWADVERA